MIELLCIFTLFFGDAALSPLLPLNEPWPHFVDEKNRATLASRDTHAEFKKAFKQKEIPWDRFASAALFFAIVAYVLQRKRKIKPRPSPEKMFQRLQTLSLDEREYFERALDILRMQLEETHHFPATKRTYREIAKHVENPDVSAFFLLAEKLQYGGLAISHVHREKVDRIVYQSYSKN